MLTRLNIQNFAILDDWQLDFSSGETVITGETGSGKSLFVDALSFLLGSRSDRNWKKDPNKKTLVEGEFFIENQREKIASFLSELDIAMDEGNLVISRQLDEYGSKARVNNQYITAKNLTELSAMFMDIHAQNAQSILADKKNYLSFLDTYAGKKLEEGKKELRKLYQEKKDLLKNFKEYTISEEEANQEMDLLNFQIDEIEKCQLEDLDIDELNKEYRQLSSSVDRLNAVNEILQNLSYDMSISSLFEQVAGQLAEFGRFDENMKEYKDQAWKLQAEVEGFLKDLESYKDSIDIDPFRIEEIDLIFSSIQKLKRKYGKDKEEILNFLQKAKERRNFLQNMEETRNRLVQKIEEYDQKLMEKAKFLHEERVKAGMRLEKEISLHLREMAIKKLSFQVELKEKELDLQGIDAVDFLISTNPGEPLYSVSQVASGGEMSRFMLAFKIVIASVDQISSLLFDEIDTGISGRTAQVVAEKLYKLAKNHQVIVISHLPQIAALADHHYKISKFVTEDRTYSQIEILDEKNRIDEQARLIGGVLITDLTKKSALEMLKQADLLKMGEDHVV